MLLGSDIDVLKALMNENKYSLNFEDSLTLLYIEFVLKNRD